MLEKGGDGIIPYKSTFFAVAICECILALSLILCVFATKLFAPKVFESVKEKYEKNAKVDINVAEFIKEVTDENKTVRN